MNTPISPECLIVFTNTGTWYTDPHCLTCGMLTPHNRGQGAHFPQVGVTSHYGQLSALRMNISFEANWMKANNFHPVADKFVMCTDGK